MSFSGLELNGGRRTSIVHARHAGEFGRLAPFLERPRSLTHAVRDDERRGPRHAALAVYKDVPLASIARPGAIEEVEPFLKLAGLDEV